MYEPISPELALVDPELAARARAALPVPFLDGPVRARSPQPEVASVATAPGRQAAARPYPLWARMTAALWLLVLGILIGGAAIPHAQDTPRILPPAENVICEPEKQIAPAVPDVGSPLRPGP